MYYSVYFSGFYLHLLNCHQKRFPRDIAADMALNSKVNICLEPKEHVNACCITASIYLSNSGFLRFFLEQITQSLMSLLPKH